MYSQLARFEILYLLRKPITWISVLAFLLLGLAMGSMRNLPFAGIARNAPYLITYFTGIATLGTIFTITVTVAQSSLKDRVANFEPILFTTPVRKFDYLAAQIAGIFVVVFVSFSFAILGLIAGQYAPGIPAAERDAFRLLPYLWPMLVLTLPNMLLCIAVTASISLLTRSALGVYTGGLLIYVLYIAGSLISNSPLMASASPATPEAMSLVARFDPFGLAAFFEQTRYWTLADRNTKLLSLKDEFLFNRIFYLLLTVLIFVLTYLKFSFRHIGRGSIKKDRLAASLVSIKKYTSQQVDLSHAWWLRSAWSIVKLDLQLVVKGVPFIVIMILLSGLLVLELTNEISGGVRMAARYADTALMFTGIMSNLPFFGSVVVLFYSNELLWKTHITGMAAIATTNPVKNSIFYTSKLAGLATIIFFMITWSVLMGVIVQVSYGYAIIRWSTYTSLLYYAGLPLLLLAVLLLFLQNAIRHKYLGLVLGAVFIMLFNSKLGQALGIHHPLLRFADPLTIPYLDMNGFGEYRISFLWQVMNEVSLATLLGLCTSMDWMRNYSFGSRRLFDLSVLKKHFVVPLVALLVFLGSSGFIYYQTSIHPIPGSDERFDWRENYERQYKRFETLGQPAVAVIKASVDLYPGDHRYEVKGTYLLFNKTKSPIDSLLLYFDENIQLRKLQVPGGHSVINDAVSRHQLIVLRARLQPGDSLTLSYEFSSSWSPFAKHTPFNSIIENGSFIRMSRYFPQFGYQSENEIDLEAERRKRHLPPATPLRSVDASEVDPTNYVNLDMLVSTDADQTAVGSGELIRSWKAGDRSFFHYKTKKPIPFRFAFSSARYAIRKEKYDGLSIEIFYDPRHFQNVDRLVQSARQTLDYATTNFGGYPFQSIRFAEISDFATGFAATAYPSVIYMKEGMGFNADLRKPTELDVINQLAGHELSHLWWGSAQLSPDQREGYGLMTETLAQYTELMLYRKAHGNKQSIELVKVHLDLYLAARGYQHEVPLYRADFESPHLVYNKGMVVLYQLEQIVGERSVNAALADFLAKYRYPNRAPTSPDLIECFYQHSPANVHPKIDELFKLIITHEANFSNASIRQLATGRYQLDFAGELRKFKTIEEGTKVAMHADSFVDVAVVQANGQEQIIQVPVSKNRFSASMLLPGKPRSIQLDPLLKLMDEFPGDNLKTFLLD